MEIIKNYNNALQAIYDHVGFVEDWVVCPIDDQTDMYWCIDGDFCRFASTEEDVRDEEDEGGYYEDSIYKQRFYDKYVYEGEEFTMVFCDTHTDNMKWFRIFDNEKRITI